jgi:mannosyltransferase OCH1-like enzyme
MRYAEGWRERHPGWSYVLWTDCPPEFEVYDLWRNAEKYVPEANVGQFRSDLLRYEVLYHFGGVYVDTDMEPRQPIDGLLGPGCWAAWEQQDVWIGNAIIGAERHAPFLRRILDALPDSVERNVGRRPNISTGPHLVTKLYREHPNELRVYPQGVAYPYRWDEPHRADERFPDALCIHRWSNRTGVGREPTRVPGTGTQRAHRPGK